MIVYLLIDGREFVPYIEKWRIFQDKEHCLIEARKLGYGSGFMGEAFKLRDEPGRALMEKSGDTDVTIVPVLVECAP